jgi:hypothetical protein
MYYITLVDNYQPLALRFLSYSVILVVNVLHTIQIASSWLIRVMKRIGVLAVGIIVIWISTQRFLPFFETKVPLFFALFFTYVATAYFFVPALFRIYRFFYRPVHIPRYCVTPDGFASDPINIGFVGTKKQIKNAMMRAGWHEADKRSIRTLWKLFRSIVFRQSYLNAPFSTLYLFGRSQDIGFQKPIEGSSSHRHHVRFWACHLEGPEKFHEHVIFWKRFHRPTRSAKIGRQLYVGAASKDIGIKLIRHNLQFTHMIHPDTDSERELIVNDVRQSTTVKGLTKEITGTPLRLRNRVLGGHLESDGYVSIIIL